MVYICIISILASFCTKINVDLNNISSSTANSTKSFIPASTKENIVQVALSSEAIEKFKKVKATYRNARG